MTDPHGDAAPPDGAREVRPGTLYLVPTPLGNSDDLSPRARRVLAEVDLVAAEDTRETGALLAKLGIRASLHPCHEHNEARHAGRVVGALRDGKSVALVSDAGTPLVNDPGFPVVRAVLDAGLPVVALPGPSAPLTALIASGLPPQHHVHLGFLPRGDGKRAAFLDAWRHHPGPLSLFEAPNRVLDALDALQAALGDRSAAVAVNLTKRDERVLRGRISELQATLRAEGEVKGQITVVVGPGEADPEAERRARALAAAARLIPHGVPTKDLAAALAGALDLSARDLYREILRLRSE